MKILVAEDDPVSQKMLELSLKQWGHTCVSTGDGREALAAWKGSAFDVLITDWMMPESDGIDLVEKMRALEGERYTWTVLLTTKVFKDNYARAMNAGVDDFLTKPLDRELLRVRLAVADRILGLKKKVREMESLIPICMHCKAVRDSGSHWKRIEEYLSTHVTADLSHGYCPECYLAESVVPAVDKLKEQFPSPPPTRSGAGMARPIDPAALGWLRSHEEQAPGLADELLEGFSLAVPEIEHILSHQHPRPDEIRRVRRFATSARLIGAVALADALDSAASGETHNTTLAVSELGAVVGSELLKGHQHAIE